MPESLARSRMKPGSKGRAVSFPKGTNLYDLEHTPRQIYVLNAGQVRLSFRFTNVELAKMVGTTRWRVSHLLNRFQRLGWLRRDRELWVQREGIQEYLAAQ